jgi:hypothetical protein
MAGNSLRSFKNSEDANGSPLPADIKQRTCFRISDEKMAWCIATALGVDGITEVLQLGHFKLHA